MRRHWNFCAMLCQLVLAYPLIMPHHVYLLTLTQKRMEAWVSVNCAGNQTQAFLITSDEWNNDSAATELIPTTLDSINKFQVHTIICNQTAVSTEDSDYIEKYINCHILLLAFKFAIKYRTSCHCQAWMWHKKTVNLGEAGTKMLSELLQLDMLPLYNLDDNYKYN